MEDRKVNRRKSTQLGVRIEAAQNRQLNQLIEVTGRRKSEIVGEALQILFAEYRQMGVLK